MNDDLPVPAGLCAGCRWQRIVAGGRGSAFSLCRKSETDPRFPKYPPLPVTACGGYEPTAATSAGSDRSEA